ncbi:S8 family serine peptidase [Luteolibacter marinus]|uniref:S8 family serine peptidase n=1 Tax=Luteolibacter marinus TaxID=2776705 RepID=UPI001868C919|nr:S8 family serine peptidase [Luteolibacter marinus]
MKRSYSRFRLAAGLLLFSLLAVSLWLALQSQRPGEQAPRTALDPEPTQTHGAASRISPTPGSTKVADRNEPEVRIETRLAAIRLRREEFRDLLNKTPEETEILQALKKLADEEQELTTEMAGLREIPLVTADGSRLSHFEGDRPVYLRDLNANAAISSAASQIRSTSPYSVDGDGVIIGLWEVGGVPRDTHDDLTGRVTLAETASTSYHATHVAGTLIGDGTSGSSVKGMAPAATISAYAVSSTSDYASESKSAAATGEGSTTKIYLANNSWAASSGWVYSSTTGSYSWYGTFSDDGNSANDQVDNYGRYSSDARSIDITAADRPYLAIFFAAGNDRGYSTPATGATWYHNGSTPYTYDPATHPKDNEDWMVDGSVTGFGTMSTQASAKNVIAIGAVNDAVSGGSRSTAAATMSTFSSYGPTDDGRIKPDLVANGVSVTSLSSASDSATSTENGTSMACPSAAGSAALLVDYFDKKFSGQSMRASMLKALLIHTADDLGNAGPDYRYGWGLINVRTAADLIKDTASDTTKARFLDGRLSTTDSSDTFTFDYDGSGEIRVTLAWTDPEGTANNAHNSRTSCLIHDLNLKLTGPDGTHYPYVMPWKGNWSDSKLNDNATTGVNDSDNVEQVYLSAPVPGTYTITVDYAGSLTANQTYSLVLTGGDFASEVPDGGSDLSYTKVVGFGSIQPFNVYDRFNSAHETTYSISSDATSIATATIDGSGNVIITEAGTTGTAHVDVTATNDLGGSDTVRITVTVKANVIYVDASHTSGTKNGNSWSTAYDKLYDAISAASSGQEIWVADGVYYPTITSSSPSPTQRLTSFTLPASVSIYGGFSGSETSLDERDPDTNLSILSGDLDRNDANRSDNITDKSSELSGSNSTRVVYASSSSDSFLLDGFTITAGQTSSGPLGSNDDGPGMTIDSGCVGGIVSNCRFMGNDAEDQGGAVYNGGTSTTFESCTFSGNEAGTDGGALSGNKAVTLVDCTFQSNDALGNGGALYLTGSTHLVRRCIFQANTSQADAGAISFNGGGNAVFTNCLITGNDAAGSGANGGAFGVGNGSTITITNCTICSNNSKLPGGAFWVFGSSKVYMRNTIVYRNAVSDNESHGNAFYYIWDSASSTIYWTYSINPSTTSGGTNPDLENVPAASAAPTTAGDFTCVANGNAVDHGSVSVTIDATGVYSGTASEEESDLAGNTRVVDGNYNGTVYIDAGCYELDEPVAIGTIADISLDPAAGSATGTLDLDDYFGGTNLTYDVASSSPNLLVETDSENNLTVSLANTAFGDGSFTVTITATDEIGQTASQTFTVTFGLTRIYVSATATGTGTGRSWTNAFTELRDAMAYASSGDEIWIAEGVYKPSESSATTGFTISTNLSLHGGFGGGEATLAEADPETHVTVISGDIDGDDTLDDDGVTLNYTDQGPAGGNTSVPLITINSNITATLSGLVICGGAGGGVLTNSGSVPTIADCVVRGNKKTGDGGAFDCQGGNHIFTDCKFLQNYASAHAGAIRNGAGGTTMTLDRCVLSGNRSNSNGGAYAVKGGSGSRTIRMRDCLLSGNYAANDGGAIHSWSGGTSFYLTNCTLAANKAADEGGSIYKLYGGTVAINNTVVWGNSSDPAIKTGASATATWTSCLVEGCGGSSAWDSFEMDTDGGNNLDADPFFISLPDSSTAPTLEGDFTFNATSPALDAGSDALSTSSTDLINNARVLYTAIDMGAYENISFFRPTFGLDSDEVIVDEDCGPHTERAFAEEMSANDDGQTLTGFVLTTDNDALFSVLPAVDLNGDLTFTPADDAYGTANVTIVLQDDGASVNESLPQTFPVVINPMTDAPTNMAISNTSVEEGSTFIGTVTATEPFGRAITWSIVNAEEGQAFTIDETTGQLSFHDAPDFETPLEGTNNIYNVVIMATGSDGAQTAQFSITVTDLNEDFTWVNTTGDNLWTTAANWDVAAQPNHLATVNLGAAGTVLLNDGSTQDITNLWVGDTSSHGDLQLSNASQLNVSSRLVIGNGDDDQLLLSGGSNLASAGRLQVFGQEDVTITLSGASHWTHTYSGTVDTFGSVGGVDLDILSGSSLTLGHTLGGQILKIAGNTSTVNMTVSGAGSGFDFGAHSLQLGLGGDLTLLVSDGADFGGNSGGNIILGQTYGGTVTAQVLSGSNLGSGGSVSIKYGASLLMDDASLYAETLSLIAGNATLQNGTTGTVGWINFTNPNTLTLDGTDTSLTVSGSSQSLDDGGTITVQGGASIHYTHASDFNLYSSDGGGTFTVTGSGSQATFAGGLTNSGTGSTATFTVADGADASFAGAISLTGTHGLNFTGADSSVSATGDVSLTGSNTVTLDQAATFKIGGVLYFIPSTTFNLLGGATLDVVTINNSFTNTSGILHLADTAAAGTIDGNYTQELAATLRFGIGGTTPGTGFDTLYIDGTADLAGTIEVDLLDGFTPALDDSFTVLTGSSVIDNGLVFDLPALDPGLAWETQISSHSLTFVVVAGDALATFRATYGLAEDGSDDEEDWSQNGVENIFYHLFGLGDPNDSDIDRSLLPTLTPSETEGYIVFSYRSPFPFEPVYSLPITSTDLENWSRVDELTGDDAPVSVSASMEADGYLRNTFILPKSATARFFSVRPQPTD